MQHEIKHRQQISNGSDNPYRVTSAAPFDDESRLELQEQFFLRYLLPQTLLASCNPDKLKPKSRSTIVCNHGLLKLSISSLVVVYLIFNIIGIYLFE